eukprot:scaffold59726_cov30-Tisochrysis_lutea.AAC.2
MERVTDGNANVRCAQLGQGARAAREDGGDRHGEHEERHGGVRPQRADKKARTHCADTLSRQAQVCEV